MTTMTSTKRPFQISKIIVPIITIGILVVLWRWNIKWATIPVIVFVLFYLLLLPGIVRRRTEKFNRKALMLLTSGKAKALPGLVKRSVLLQLFGPRGPLDAKLALAYVQCEEYRTAIACFESGIPTASPTERVALQSGLAKALFAVGDLARAEAEAKAIVENITRLPELLVILARSRIGLGKLDDQTRGYLDEAETLSPSSDVALMITLSRIELALMTGRKAPAFPEHADSTSKLVRTWIHWVRGLVRLQKEDAEKAAESFRKAKKTLPSCFASMAADEKLEEIADEKEQGDDIQNGKVDPAIRRKKHRRR